MRLASYKVNDEEGNELDFSVTSFPGDGGTLRQRKPLAWSNRRTTNRRGRFEGIRPTDHNRRHIGPIGRGFFRGRNSLRSNPYERQPFLVLQTDREQNTCRKGKGKLLRLSRIHLFSQAKRPEMSNKQTKTKSLWALSHRKKLLPWLAPLASLRLTLALLSLSMVLIFIATLEQVKLGIRGAQAEYFESLVGIWNYPDEFWGGGKSSPDWTRRSAPSSLTTSKPRTTVSGSRITDLKPVTSSSTWTRAREKPSKGFHATSAISQSSKRIPIIFSNSRPTNPAPTPK